MTYSFPTRRVLVVELSKKDAYTGSETLRNPKKLTELLVPFLDILISRNHWKVSIGHVITQCARPMRMSSVLQYI